MSASSETKTLLGGKSKHLLLDDNLTDRKSFGERATDELFSALFVMLVKSNQLFIHWLVPLFICLLEMFQMLSLVFHPVYYWSNAIGGIVYQIFGITSFISLHIYSSTSLFWLLFSLLCLLTIFLIVLFIMQSSRTRYPTLLKILRGVFCITSSLLFIPILIMCIAALTCRMGTTNDIGDYTYCWDFSYTMAGTGTIFPVDGMPDVSTMQRLIMVLSIPAAILHILYAFLYAAIAYEDNPLNASTVNTAIAQSRTWTSHLVGKITLVVNVFILTNYIPSWISATINVVTIALMLHSFVMALPFYAFWLNELYSALLVLLMWASVCSLASSFVRNSSDHSTAVILYLTAPLALATGAMLARSRRRRVEVHDCIELHSAPEVELKVRFLLDPITRERFTDDKLGEALSVSPEHQPFLHRASEWFALACERWPKDAYLLMAAARFHTLYLHDTYSGTRLAKRALLCQPSLDTQFAIYRLQQLVTHLYEEQQYALTYVDTVVMTGVSDSLAVAQRQKRHRDLMINLALERHVAEAVSVETKANRTQLAFWEEISKAEPQLDYLAELAHQVATYTERAGYLSTKISRMRKSLVKATPAAGADTEEADGDAAVQGDFAAADEHSLDSKLGDATVLSVGHIVISLAVGARSTSTDAFVPNSSSASIALTGAVTSMRSPSKDNAKETAAATDPDAGRGVTGVGGVMLSTTGDKRGYTSQDGVFARDSPFKLEEVDDDIYTMFGFIPEDIFLPQPAARANVGTAGTGSFQNASTSHGQPLYNSSLFLFEPYRAEHRDFLRKYALFAIQALLGAQSQRNADLSRVQAVEGSSAVDRLLARFSPLFVLCQHSDGTVFPARVSVKPVRHPSSPLTLLMTFEQLQLPPTASLLVTDPDGRVITLSRTALGLFDPHQAMLMARSALPPLLSQQLISLVGLAPTQMHMAQTELRAKRDDFSLTMDDHRGLLQQYLSQLPVSSWIPDYAQQRHHVKQRGITLRIPLKRIINASDTHATSHVKGTGTQVFTEDGFAMNVVRTTDADFDIHRLAAYEATVRVWIAPLLNRCRMDTHHLTHAATSAASVPGSDLPAAHSSHGPVTQRRLALLYGAGGSKAKPRSRRATVSLTGAGSRDGSDDADTLLYEPSELVVPLDSDFYFKYRRKEQHVREVRDAEIARQQALLTGIIGAHADTGRGGLTGSFYGKSRTSPPPDARAPLVRQGTGHLPMTRENSNLPILDSRVASEADSTAKSTASAAPSPVFPDYGDTVYIQVVELMVPDGTQADAQPDVQTSTRVTKLKRRSSTLVSGSGSARNMNRHSSRKGASMYDENYNQADDNVSLPGSVAGDSVVSHRQRKRNMRYDDDEDEDEDDEDDPAADETGSELQSSVLSHHIAKVPMDRGGSVNTAATILEDAEDSNALRASGGLGQPRTTHPCAEDDDDDEEGEEFKILKGDNWIYGDLRQFSMTVVERYDRYQRCLRHQAASVLLKRKRAAEAKSKVLDRLKKQQAKTGVSGARAEQLQLVVTEGAEDRLRKMEFNLESELHGHIAEENRKSQHSTRRFQLAFLGAIALVLLLGLAQFLALLLQLEEHADSMYNVYEATKREEAAVRIAYNTFYLNVVRGGYVQLPEQNIDPFDVSTIQNHIESLAYILSNAHTTVISNLGSLASSLSSVFSQPSVYVYETIGAAATEISLTQATTYLVTKAQDVASLASGSVDVVTDDDAYYCVMNGAGPLLTMLSDTSLTIAISVQSSVSSLGDWALWLLVASFIVMFIIVIGLIRPTVNTIQTSKAQVMEVFMGIPVGPVRQLHATTSLRIAALTAELDVIREAQREVVASRCDHPTPGLAESDFTSISNLPPTTRGEASEYRPELKLPLTLSFILRISTVFVLAIVFFLLLYFGGYVPIADDLRQSVTTMYYTSNVSVLTSKIAVAAMMLAATSPTVEASLTSDLFSLADVTTMIDELEALDQQVVYDGTSTILSIDKAVSSGLISSDLQDLWFHDACTPVWVDDMMFPHIPSSETNQFGQTTLVGPFTFTDYLSLRNSDCANFDENIIDGGLQVSVTEFIRVMRSLVTEMTAGTASTGPNVGIVVDDMKHIHTFWRLLSSAQRTAVDYHKSRISDSVDDFKVFAIVSFVVFCILVVVAYITIYHPLLMLTHAQLKSTRAMMFYISAEVLTNVPVFQSWLKQRRRAAAQVE